MARPAGGAESANFRFDLIIFFGGEDCWLLLWFISAFERSHVGLGPRGRGSGRPLGNNGGVPLIRCTGGSATSGHRPTVKWNKTNENGEKNKKQKKTKNFFKKLKKLKKNKIKKKKKIIKYLKKKNFKKLKEKKKNF